MLNMCALRQRMMQGSLLQLIILIALYDEQSHGYKLLEKANRLLIGRRPLKAGSLYTILRRMERSGLLKSEWSRSGGLGRRVYALTEKGLERLIQGRQMVENQRSVLDEMANFYKDRFGEKASERD